MDKFYDITLTKYFDAKLEPTVDDMVTIHTKGSVRTWLYIIAPVAEIEDMLVEVQEFINLYKLEREQ